MHFGSSLSLVDSNQVIDSRDQQHLQDFVIFVVLSSFESVTAIVETLAARRFSCREELDDQEAKFVGIKQFP